jgi:hypothetical protein
MIYDKKWFKHNFILITYENKGYDMKAYPKLVLSRLKVMRFYPYLYFIEDLTYRIFHRSFHVCPNQRNFLKSLFTNSELKVN